MPVESLVVVPLAGLIVGWLAGTFVRGGTFGLVGNIVVGVAGAVIGALLLPVTGETRVSTGMVATMISATAGAVVLLLLLRLLRRA